MSEAPIPLRQRMFTVNDYPCPECRNLSVIGFLYVNEEEHHMHTHYVCTFWPSGRYVDGRYNSTRPCGWHGWSVPTQKVKREA